MLLLSLFMLLGFLQAELSGGFLVEAVAFMLVVLGPAAVGSALLYSHYKQSHGMLRRKEQLRVLTLESEIMKLATQRSGTLSESEVITETAFDQKTVQQALKSLVTKGNADVGITDNGLIVYSFPEIKLLQQKSPVRDILDEDS